MPYLSQEQIRDILPQDYPFIMLDYVEDYKEGHWLRAVKNVTANEWPFTHGQAKTAVFPETLLIEAAAQAALVLYHITMIADKNIKPSYILGKVKVMFVTKVLFGQKIYIDAYATKMIKRGGVSEVNIRSDVSIAKIDLIFKVKR